MKTMKLFSMAAVALLMAACSNNDDFDVQKPAEKAGVYHFEATIAAPDADASMRTVYTEEGTTINVKWKVGDQIALVHNGVKDVAEVKAVDGSGNATIEADFTVSPKDNDDVYLAYPADAVYSATPYSPFPFTPNPTTINKVKNSQDGTLEYIQNNLDLRMGGGKLTVSGDKVTLKESVSVSSLICIWKLTLQDESSNALSATQLKFINNPATQAKATSTGMSEYYLCVVPSFIPDPSGTFSFVATVGSDTYIFSTTGLSLTAGKYYQSTVTMAKVLTYPVALSAVTADYVGSVVTTDCNVYAKVSEIPAGKTAAAMIAYVSGTGTGLAIALADDGSRDWNSAKSTCENKTAIGGNSWHLPSQAEWKQMFSANGGNDESYTGLNTAITTAGGTALNGKYWSSSEGGYWDDDDGYNEANFVELYNGDTFWSPELKNESRWVRAVLAF